jgi:hypothetical protein
VLVCETPAVSPNDQCSNCGTDKIPTFDQRNCLACTNSDTQTIINQKCYTKIENCQDYLSYDDFCQNCNAGYERDEFGQCNKGCKDNQTWENNICFNNIEKCEKYALYKEGQKCVKCSEGYKLNSSQNKCIKCPEGFVSNDGIKCVCDGTNKIEISGECFDIINNCKEGQQTKEDVCEKCNTDFKLADDKKSCTACTTGTEFGDGLKCYTAITGCKEYDNNGNCKICNTNFKLADDKKSCTACTTGTEFGDGLKCYTAITGCKEYDNNGNCKICNTDFKLADDKKSCTACTTGTEVGDGLKCYTAITGCKEYDNNGDCKICNTNFKLANDKKECTGCNEITLVGDGKKCYTVINDCKEYDDNGDCKICNTDFKLAVDKKSCSACNAGTEVGDGIKCFINCIQIGDENCIEKIDNCLDQEDDLCLKCNLDYELSNDKKKCIQCTDGNKSDGIVSCFKIDKCQKYEDYIYGNNKIFGCSACESNSIYLTTAKHQCNENGLGKYKLGNNLIDEINNCVVQKSQKECTQCLPGYKVKKGKCYPCVAPYIGTDGKTCYLPHMNCITDESGKCSSCQTPGYKLTKNKQYCYLEGTNDPTNNSCNLFNLNILLLMLFGFLI